METSIDILTFFHMALQYIRVVCLRITVPLTKWLPLCLHAIFVKLFVYHLSYLLNVT